MKLLDPDNNERRQWRNFFYARPVFIGEQGVGSLTREWVPRRQKLMPTSYQPLFPSVLWLHIEPPAENGCISEILCDPPSHALKKLKLTVVKSERLESGDSREDVTLE